MNTGILFALSSDFVLDFLLKLCVYLVLFQITLSFLFLCLIVTLLIPGTVVSVSRLVTG